MGQEEAPAQTSAPASRRADPGSTVVPGSRHLSSGGRAVFDGKVIISRFSHRGQFQSLPGAEACTQGLGQGMR
jgi:hypothetical protein